MRCFSRNITWDHTPLISTQWVASAKFSFLYMSKQLDGATILKFLESTLLAPTLSYLFKVRRKFRHLQLDNCLLASSFSYLFLSVVTQLFASDSKQKAQLLSGAIPLQDLAKLPHTPAPVVNFLSPPEAACRITLWYGIWNVLSVDLISKWIDMRHGVPMFSNSIQHLESLSRTLARSMARLTLHSRNISKYVSSSIYTKPKKVYD